MRMDVGGWVAAAVPMITAVGLKIVGAIILYVIGRWLINVAVGLMSRVLTARNFDPTLHRQHSRRCP
jgi:small conductance mechanosensitive channel